MSGQEPKEKHRAAKRCGICSKPPSPGRSARLPGEAIDLARAQRLTGNERRRYTLDCAAVALHQRARRLPQEGLGSVRRGIHGEQTIDLHVIRIRPRTIRAEKFQLGGFPGEQNDHASVLRVETTPAQEPVTKRSCSIDDLPLRRSKRASIAAAAAASIKRHSRRVGSRPRSASSSAAKRLRSSARSACLIRVIAQPERFAVWPGNRRPRASR
jgi:hypothetical protein